MILPVTLLMLSSSAHRKLSGIRAPPENFQTTTDDPIPVKKDGPINDAHHFHPARHAYRLVPIGVHLFKRMDFSACYWNRGLHSMTKTTYIHSYITAQPHLLYRFGAGARQRGIWTNRITRMCVFDIHISSFFI